MAAAAAIALRPALGTLERSTSRLKTRFDKPNNRATEKSPGLGDFYHRSEARVEMGRTLSGQLSNSVLKRVLASENGASVGRRK